MNAFIHCIFLASLSKIKYVVLFLDLLFYIIDQPVSVPMPGSFYPYWSVLQLEVRDAHSSWSSFIVKNSFCFSLFFKWIWKLHFPCLWRNVLGFWWGFHWIFRFPLVGWTFLTMLCLSIHEYARLLHFLRSTLITFLKDLKLFSYRSFILLVWFIPSYFCLVCRYCEKSCCPNFFLSLFVFCIKKGY